MITLLFHRNYIDKRVDVHPFRMKLLNTHHSLSNLKIKHTKRQRLQAKEDM